MYFKSNQIVKKLIEFPNQKKRNPCDFKNQIIFYFLTLQTQILIVWFYKSNHLYIFFCILNTLLFKECLDFRTLFKDSEEKYKVSLLFIGVQVALSWCFLNG